MTRPRAWRRLINPLNLGGFAWLLFGAGLTSLFAALWKVGAIDWPWWAITSPLWLVGIGVVLAAFWPKNYLNS